MNVEDNSTPVESNKTQRRELLIKKISTQNFMKDEERLQSMPNGDYQDI